MRAIGSVPPPGGKGTMNLIGPLDHSACALTMEGAAMAELMPVSTARRYISVMHCLPLFLLLWRACRRVGRMPTLHKLCKELSYRRLDDLKRGMAKPTR